MQFKIVKCILILPLRKKQIPTNSTGAEACKKNQFAKAPSDFDTGFFKKNHMSLLCLHEEENIRLGYS